MLTAQVAVGTSERDDGKEGDQNKSQKLHYRSRERVIREVSRAGMKRGGVRKEKVRNCYTTWVYIYDGAHQSLEKFLLLKLDHAQSNVPFMLEPVRWPDGPLCAG